MSIESHPLISLVGLGLALASCVADEVERDERDERESVGSFDSSRNADGPDDPDVDPEPLDFRRAMAEPGAGTVCGHASEPPRLSVIPDGERPLAVDSPLSLAFHNHKPVAAGLTVSASVISEQGVVYRPALATLDLAPNGVGEVDVSMKELGLSDEIGSGHIHVTATAEFADGSSAALPTSYLLELSSDADGLRVTPVDRRAPESADAAVPTYVERVSASTDWRPSDELGDTSPELVGGDDHDEVSADPIDDDEHGLSAVPERLPGGLELPAMSVEPRTADANDGDVDTILPEIKFCFKGMSTYTDAGHGEDYWTNDWATARSTHGMHVAISTPGGSVWYLYTGDGHGPGDPGAGCTSTFTSTGIYDFTVHSHGRVQGNWISSVDDDAPDTIQTHSLQALAINGSGTYTVTFSPTKIEFNTYMVGARSIYKHAGGLSGESYKIRDDANDSLTSGGTIYIETGDEEKKFVIAHEMGHAVGGKASGGRLAGNNCSYSSLSCPSNGTHAMTSKEYSNCAIGEGFAHFYSADVWNSHSQTDCWFEYWGSGTPSVNCESGNSSFPNAYMEAMCDPSYGGRGVELDWLRQFWDVHTNGSGPTFNTMIDWINQASAWGTTNGYGLLDAAANSANSAVNNNWDNVKFINGVDH